MFIQRPFKWCLVDLNPTIFDREPLTMIPVQSATMKFIRHFPRSPARCQSALLPGGPLLVHWGSGGLALVHWRLMGRTVVSTEALLHAMVRFSSSSSPQWNQISNRQVITPLLVLLQVTLYKIISTLDLTHLESDSVCCSVSLSTGHCVIILIDHGFHCHHHCCHTWIEHLHASRH